MITFYQFLENINNLVQINTDNLRKILSKKIEDFFNQYENETEDLKNFKLDLNYVKKELKDYPKINELISKLSNSSNRLAAKEDWSDDLWNWQKSLSGEERYKIFDAVRYLWKYLDSLDDRKINKEEYYNLLNKVLEKTNENMLDIKKKIDQAISNIDWNGSKITINPIYNSSNEDFLSPSESAEIKVGNKNGDFQIWKEGEKITIEDILEADEEESEYFFTNNEEKQDYYNLISQLQNPNKKDQILTLYTARPIKDREFYKKTNYLPANIFLSNSFNHVDGLASDLSSGDRRDIYKVRINSKYVVKTLDGPVKYYQVIKDAPIEQIDLY
jgi:hypothetical protein